MALQLLDAPEGAAASAALDGSVQDRRRAHTGYTSSLRREHGWEPLRVEGAVPAGLRGTLLRNGPGLYELFERPYSHMFEGDGALLGVRFDDAGVAGAHRLVQSAELLEERRAGRPLYGSNATQLSRTWRNLRLKRKNAANTSVLAWQGRLFALFEAGPPTEVALDDLSTVGATDLGVITDTFSAHPHRVPARAATYNFGQAIGPRPKVDVYELPDEGEARRIAEFRLRAPVMLHDFIATDEHLVFFVCPAKLSLWRGLLGIGGLDRIFRWTPEEGTEVIVVPIDRPEAITRFHVDSFWLWHFGNAFARDGKIVLDYVRYDDFGSLDALQEPGAPVRQGYLVRAELDPVAKTLGPPRRLYPRGCEFPVVDPARVGRPTDVVWVASEDGLARIARVDALSGEAREWTAAPDERVSEPVLVDDPAGGAGWALTLVYDASRHESSIVILDRDAPQRGPLARAWLGHHVPLTFHGIFLPAWPNPGVLSTPA